MIRNFKIEETVGGLIVTVPKHGVLDFRQTYEPIGGSATLRLSDGGSVKQTHWRKRATSINGTGWLPPGVHQLNYNDPVRIHCAAPRAITSDDPNISVPGTVRTDSGHETFGRVLIDGEWSEFTLGEAVPGAELYQAVYWPILTINTDGPRETVDAGSAEYSWQISGEEA